MVLIRQLLPLSALLLASGLLVMGNGLATLLIPTRASLEGWSTGTVGLMGAAYALAFTLGCVVVPRLVGRVGHIRVFAALGTLVTISMLLLALEVTQWFWIAIRGLAGFSIAGSYMILESWLNEEVSNENRGTIFSIYMVVNMLGLALGPYLVSFGHPENFSLFAWAAILYALCTLPIALTSARSPQPLARVSLDLPALYRNSPASAVGSLLTGIVSGAWFTLVPVFASESGLGTAAAATLLATANVGAMLFQLPVGRLSDRIDRRLVMVGLGIAGALLSLAVATLGGTIPVAVLTFLMGTTIFTAYSINVAHANDWAKDMSFVAVASGLLILYGAGSTVGPLIASAVMEVVGPNGLFVSIGTAQALYAAFAMWRVTQRADAPEEEQGDFRSLPIQLSATPQTFEFDPRSEDAVAPVEPEDESAPNPVWGWEYRPGADS